MARKIITILTVFSLVMPVFVETAQAGVLGTGLSFGSCAAGGFLSGKINEGLTELENWTKGDLKNWLIRRRIIPIPSKSFGQQIPGYAGKVPVTDDDVKGAVNDLKGAYTSKEGIQDVIARCGAREILTAMGRNITNTARTAGRDGGPAWVRNWRNFRLLAQYRGEGVFRAMLASSNLCDYFNTSLKDQFNAKEAPSLAKIKTRSNEFDSFAVRTSCTLPRGFNFFNYKRNFSANGGWEAWSRLMEPENNYYGVLFQSLDESEKQRAIEEQADIDEAGATGFTASRGRNASGNCAVKSLNGRCLVYHDIVTPAGILSGAVTSGIEAELQWVATSDELSEIVASGVNVLLNRLIDLSDSNEGAYEVPGNAGFDPNTLPGAGEPPLTEEEIESGGTEPVPTAFGNVTVNFEITNNNGGSATADNFNLFINDEQTAIGLVGSLPIGDYKVTASAPSGYQLIGIRGACDGDGSFTLAEGQNLICTVAYDDI